MVEKKKVPPSEWKESPFIYWEDPMPPSPDFDNLVEKFKKGKNQNYSLEMNNSRKPQGV